MNVSLQAQATGELISVGADGSVAMRQLFAEVFGHEMSAEHWHWKYADGRGCAVGLMQDGRLLAHYGGVTRQMVLDGRPLQACQVCDVMVAPSANRALVRKGPIYRVTAHFLEQQVGHGKPHPLAYGFPNERAHAVAHRLGLYGRVDTTVGLSWPAAPAQPHPQRRLQRLNLQPNGALEQRAAVDRIWSRMAAALPHSVLGVRNGAWLSHRYLSHPTISYEVWLVRQGLLRRPLGVIVLRQRETHLDLLDLVAPPSAFGALIDVACSRAHALGLQRVEAWVTESHSELLAGQGAAPATPTGMRLPLPHNLHTSGPTEDEMRDRWFLMAGDADFT